MKADIFSYRLYKDYLNERLDDENYGGGRGARARLSFFIGCQTAYTAQVLRGNAHFSMEQAEAINEFLNHTDEEGTFFLLLVQLERAGTAALRRRIQKYINDMIASRRDLKNRLGVGSVLDIKAQSKYYSTWYFAAIHALVSVPGFQTPEAISNRMRLPSKVAAEAIEFLISIGILVRNPKTGKLEVGTARIHLGKDSPLINKHHMNWRMQAINALERGELGDLHYSSAISVSKTDSEKIREIFTQAIQESKKIIKDSKEEVVMALCLDFFSF